MQENGLKKWRLVIAAEVVLCLTALAGILCTKVADNISYGNGKISRSDEWAREALSEGYIKWVDFGVTYEALCLAYEWDVNTYTSEVHLDWIEMLAYLGARYGGNFEANASHLEKDMAALAKKRIEEQCKMEDLTKDMEYYEYYEEAYRAVLGGLVGEYEIAETDEQGNVTWTKVYGLKGYSPIAKDFYYEDYADFGASRSYGYDRKHLGHDMIGQIGTPIRI